MRQFEFEYSTNANLLRDLQKISVWLKSNIVSEVVFHIFTEKLNKDRIDNICNLIKTEIPNAKYIGCSTNGNVFSGNFTRNDTIVCTVFEYMSTKVDILQYKLTDSTEKSVVENLKTYLNTNTWVKSIEFVTTIRGMSMTKFCAHLSRLPENIKIFGGGAFCGDLNNNGAYIFSSNSECSDHSIAFLLIGGNDYYVSTSFVNGWKPLGRELKVTKANGPELIELDNKPAYETYYKYLKIKNDANFFKNTLEFPFFYKHNGIDILRAPISSTADGTLIMTSDIEENSNARMAYGDPWTILEYIKQDAQTYANFIPEAIAVFSCAGRRTFWGDNEVSKELMPYQQIASTYGFYTSSEFQRTNNEVIQHNVTLAIAAMREGKVIDPDLKPDVSINEDLQGGASMVNRLTNFIQASTEELEEAIAQLQQMAMLDGMTGLLNRTEIQRRIIANIENKKDDNMSLIMLDIDNFKHINDTYGHAEGDNVIIALANMMKKNSNQHGETSNIGRWGGEEFMILCSNTPIEEARKVAEYIRLDFENLKFEKACQCTVSVGITKLLPTDTSDTICQRVDNALYEAKTTGKNKVVEL